MHEDASRLTTLSASSSAPSSRVISSIVMLSREVRQYIKGLQLPPTSTQEGSCNKKAGPPIMAVAIWAYEYCDKGSPKIRAFNDTRL